LKRAIKSILEMRKVNIEIIVIDDCSECNNYSMIEEQFGFDKIVYIRNERNMYAALCREKGFDISKGKYVVFCDDDDFYTDSGFFSRAVDVLNDDSVSFVSGNADICIEDTGEKKKNRLNVSGLIDGMKYFYSFQNKYKKPLSTFTTVFRSDVIKQNVSFFNDSTLYLGALLGGSAFLISDVIGNYCIHSGNISLNIKQSFIEEALESKYKLYKKVNSINHNEFKNMRWWSNQFVCTLKYYIRNSNIQGSDAIKIIKEMSSYYPVGRVQLNKLKLWIRFWGVF